MEDTLRKTKWDGNGYDVSRVNELLRHGCVITLTYDMLKKCFVVELSDAQGVTHEEFAYPDKHVPAPAVRAIVLAMSTIDDEFDDEATDAQDDPVKAATGGKGTL